MDPPPKRPRLPPTPEGHYRDRDGNLRAIIQPGTPEFADAERRGDWKALGWT